MIHAIFNSFAAFSRSKERWQLGYSSAEAVSTQGFTEHEPDRPIDPPGRGPTAETPIASRRRMGRFTIAFHIPEF